ncbi:T9SS type A sorting domain-containing protein [Halosquirtibacter xylanolyticus]|uniref:T9SS type A sorting domain-containing protein n=1 Tax=Halosquirtibacter xylanolyticus TaxID=3374599 RepID=UPI00374A4C1A|nr:T9SS type A sorting domain-containing protein [Prolixibacteraceae bacterium]
MNKRLHIWILLSLFVCSVYAQKSYVSIKGATINLTKDVNVIIHGDFESKGEKSKDQSYIRMDGNFTISGDIQNNSFPLFDEFSSGFFTFIGNQEQYVKGEGPIRMSNLEVNKAPTDPTEKPKLFIEAPLEISKEVKLSSGIVDIGDEDISLKENATVIRSVDGAGCFFNTNNLGSIKKFFAFGADPALVFNLPIGANNQYSPVSIRFEDLNPENDNAHIRFKANGKRHTTMPTDGNFLNRYWEIENTDISTETKYHLSFYYDQADVASEEVEKTFEGIELKQDEGFLMPFNTLEKVDDQQNRFYVTAKGQMMAFTAGDMRSATFSDVIVFPNPNDGHFSIKIDNPNDKNMQYEFYNIYGQRILSGVTERGIFKFNFSKFPKGVYFYKIYFSKKTISRKITIQ